MGRVVYMRAREARPAAPERAPSPPAAARSLLHIGHNCAAVARAERFALLVDAQAYFRAFYDAALLAQRSITILAWDFNSRTRLHFDPLPPGGAPAELGEFLNFLVRRRRGLHVNILNWDYPMVFGADREFPPLYGLGWTPARRIRLRYDDTHPVTGSQHQKIVVIDGRLAFTGGIDLTQRRWDTSEHKAVDPRRTADGKPYPPFHDMMVAVDGAAAAALDAVARERWEIATGSPLRLEAPSTAERAAVDPWPKSIEPDLTDIDVGISRTLPPRGETPGVKEIERLYLDMIRAARGTIYVENQYFTAPRIAAALVERLAEPDGPEVVIVLRKLSHGWLEEATMHVLRTRLIARLRGADLHGRLRVYTPHIPGLEEGSCLDIHSKLMIVDDRLLRVGSANLCNRSMSLDSECDTLVESRGDARVAAVIAGFRDRLVAEHLDVPREALQRKLRELGSLREAIDALRSEGRSLRPLEDVPDYPDAVLSVASVADPEEPISLPWLEEDRRAGAAEPETPVAWAQLAFIGVVVLALMAAWRYTPLAHIATPERIIDWAHEFGSRPWAPIAVMAAYTPACLVMFPRPLLTLAGVIAFGPWLGFAYALVGIVASAIATYYAGRRMRRDTVRRLAGRRLDRMIDVLRKNGLLAMTLLRLVPVAPFAVEGIVAGAVHLRLRDLVMGTAIGMVPGTLAATIFGDQIETALTGGPVNWWVVGGCAFALGAGLVAVRRWFSRAARRVDEKPGEVKLPG